VRVNPKLYFGMSNAQVAALASVVVGLVVIGVAQSRRLQWAPELAADSRS
jgi:phosphatidylglycerol:prolipoprotein diacylglycerol transferase